jgi:hypothetical protein
MRCWRSSLLLVYDLSPAFRQRLQLDIRKPTYWPRQQPSARVPRSLVRRNKLGASAAVCSQGRMQLAAPPAQKQRTATSCGVPQIGSGCASVLNTYESSGMTCGSENSR